jgi:hypothetical protein
MALIAGQGKIYDNPLRARRIEDGVDPCAAVVGVIAFAVSGDERVVAVTGIDIIVPLGAGQPIASIASAQRIVINLKTAKRLRRPPMSAPRPLSGVMRTSASDCRTIAIYEYTT